MSRRRAAVKRHLMPDPKYGNPVISKFINYVMLEGKKSVAEAIVYEAIEMLAEKLSKDPMEAFEQTITNVRPVIEVRSRRVGGATYQVPMEVRPERSLALSVRWLTNAARARKSEKTMGARLAAEFIDAYNERGAAVKKREDTHKMAEANKVFAQYRW